MESTITEEQIRQTLKGIPFEQYPRVFVYLQQRARIELIQATFFYQDDYIIQQIKGICEERLKLIKKVMETLYKNEKNTT